MVVKLDWVFGLLLETFDMPLDFVKCFFFSATILCMGEDGGEGHFLFLFIYYYTLNIIHTFFLIF